MLSMLSIAEPDLARPPRPRPKTLRHSAATKNGRRSWKVRQPFGECFEKFRTPWFIHDRRVFLQHWMNCHGYLLMYRICFTSWLLEDWMVVGVVIFYLRYAMRCHEWWVNSPIKQEEKRNVTDTCWIPTSLLEATIFWEKQVRFGGSMCQWFSHAQVLDNHSQPAKD